MIKISQSCREGFSLLEVLISVFVVLIGLLGVATMIPAGRYEMLQARKVDMGANLSRAVMNSVISQLGTSWKPGNNNYFIVANDGGELASRLSTGLGNMGLTNLSDKKLYNNRTLNGDDDLALIDDNEGKIELSFDNGEAIGTGAYTAFATVVALGNGFYEVTGGVAYRYDSNDANEYQRGSYVFGTDKSGKYHWYKIENVYGTSVTTSTESISNQKYLGDVVGICKKVVRIDNSYSD